MEKGMRLSSVGGGSQVTVGLGCWVARARVPQGRYLRCRSSTG